MNSRRKFVSFCSLLAVVACGDAASESSPYSAPMTASSVWLRAADSGATTSVFFVLENPDTLADTLVSARSDFADEAGLSVSLRQGGRLEMTTVRALPVPAMDSVSFRSLGAQVVLSGLRMTLNEGDSVPVTLEFGSGRSLEVTASVRSP